MGSCSDRSTYCFLPPPPPGLPWCGTMQGCRRSAPGRTPRAPQVSPRAAPCAAPQATDTEPRPTRTASTTTSPSCTTPLPPPHSPPRTMTVTVRKSFEVLLNFERLFYSIILSESVQKVRFVLINIFRQTETLLEHVFSFLQSPS